VILDVVGPVLSYCILFSTMWLSGAGIAHQFRRPGFRSYEATGAAGCVGNAYELMRRLPR
jgi:hypothetical protein